MYDIFVLGNNPNWKKIKTKYPFAKKVESFTEAKTKSLTSMFWTVWDDIEVSEDFDFTLSVPKWDEDYVHVFKNSEYFDGLSLVPKNKHISQKEIQYRWFVDKKEIDTVASVPKKYDIFEIETYEQYLEAMDKSTTDMFWMTSPNLKIADGFNFDLYITHHNSYERQENHAFINQVGDEKLYNGIFLLSKHKPVSAKEIEHRYIIERKEWNIVASVPCQYDIFTIETYEQYLEAMEQSKTEMFWMTTPNVKIADNFNFDLYFSHDKIYDRTENHAFVHLVNGEKLYNGVFLISKKKPVSAKEIAHRYIIDRKEWDIVASGPCQYDRFIVDTYEQYQHAITNSKTEMFYLVPSDICIHDDFKFDIYYSHDKEFERTSHHAFLNGVFYDGIFLVSKYSEISQKEIDNKFITTRVEEDILASTPVKFDKFEIATYKDYLAACDKSTTGMFWAIWPDVEVVDDFDFEYYVPRYNQHITHVFKNGSYFDGVCLFNKHTQVNDKEFKYRFFSEKKEVDYVISYPKQYDIFEIETYEQYLEAMDKSTTDMFWMTTPNVKIADGFDFDVQCSRYENHAFIHLVNDEKLYNGIFLLSKNRPVTKKEIEHRYIIDRKEWDIVASVPCQYDSFTVETYEQYQYALENTKTEMFWVTTPNVKIADDFDFNLYFSHDKIYDRNENHTFVHLVNGEKLYNGIFLLSKHKPVSAKEIAHRYIIDRKEWDIIASVPCQYDKFIVDTYEDYLTALSESKTEMFYMIPSDVSVLDDFKFDIYYSHDKEFERTSHHALLNGVFYDGIFLVSKYSEISQKEIDNKFITTRVEEDILASAPIKFDKFEIATYQEYLEACDKSTTGMFWAIWPDVEVVDDFDFEYYVPRYNQHITHVFKNGSYFDGVCLFNKDVPVNEKEFKYRFFSEKKEVDYVISYPKKYDIFKIETYEQYLEAMSTASTDMFWMTSPNLKIADGFDFDVQCSRYENHAFIHLVNDEKLYNGIFLLSKHRPVSAKEIEHRYIIDRKEWDVVASIPCQYDIFEIETYEQYQYALENTKTEMFWMTTPNVKIADDFDFNLYFSHDRVYDRNENHAFVHLVNDEKLYNGVFLLSKHKPVSAKEINHRYIIDRKEWDTVASGPCQYEIFTVDTYEQYQHAFKTAKTEMFYIVPSDVNVLDDFKFDIYYSHDKEFERTIHHALLNGGFYDGIFLTSKHSEISQKEIDSEFIMIRVEEDILASTPIKFDKFEIATYADYLKACDKSTTGMFWAVWPDVEVVDDFDFEYYVPRYNQHITHIFKNGSHFDGVCLFNKHTLVNENEFKYRFFSEKKEVDYVISYPRPYDKFIVDTYEQYLEAKLKSTTDMFYMIPSDIVSLDDFKFDIYFSHHNTVERQENHALLNGDYYDGIFLVSKYSEISQKEIDNKFIVERKEEEILASKPVKFDVCYINSYEQYINACEKSTTTMFWAVWSDVEVVDDFEFDYYVPRYNQHLTHVFKNGEYFDGICLFNKHNRVSEKEFKYRFFSEKKEIDYVISYPKPYDTFNINTYDQYLEAKANSLTDLFWIVPNGLTILDNFKFDLYYTHHDTYNRTINHVFKNGEFYDGIMLTPKTTEISKKEFDSWFVIDRKEHDEIASTPTNFDKFEISTYTDYLEAMTKSTTGMFWAVWPDVEVVDDFEFDYYVPRYNQHITHVFKNGEYLDGICLFNKYHEVSEKEFKYRFFNEKKEVEQTASYPKKYDIFKIRNYQDYVDALSASSTDLFWMVPSEVEPLDTFAFDTYFSHHNTYDRNMNHSFKHLFRGEENYNGINLMSKHVPITEKEITFRYIVEKKEWDVTASKVKPYDIVFISYNESNADENFDRVKTLYPRVKRVHGVKGIHQAHIKAAEQAGTDNFWVVDGDAVVVDDFKFDYEIPVWEHDTVHVWRSQNPVNNLVYGYGGVKLLPRQLTLDMDVTRPDMTTSISDKFKPVQVVSNITSFNTDEFSTWKSAFRECAKLAGKTIDRQVDAETEERLNVWCTEGADKPYGEFAIKGALAGRKFATEHPENLFKINDFDWLYEQFLNEKNNSK